MISPAPALGVLLVATLFLAPDPAVQRDGGIVGGGKKSEAPQGRGATKTPADTQEPARGGGDDEDLPQKYFEIADYNSDGWITYREAQQSLGLDRESFAIYDTDIDGRISSIEFHVRYKTILDRGGSFAPPFGKTLVKKVEPMGAAELTGRFDANRDGVFDEVELRTLLEESSSRLDPSVLMVKFDRDGSHRLEKTEIEQLATFLDPAKRAASARRAASIEELFGEVILREERPGATHLPPHIPGPVPIFRRLDLDADGRIESSDLSELQRPIQLPVRLNAVLATLDTDHDGSISPAELAASMSKK